MKKVVEYDDFIKEIKVESKGAKLKLFELEKSKAPLTADDRRKIEDAKRVIEREDLFSQMLMKGSNGGRAKRLNLRAFKEEPEEYTDEQLKALNSMAKKEWNALESCFLSYKSEEFERLYGSLIEVIKHTIYVRLFRKRDFVFLGKSQAFNLFYGWVKGELCRLARKGIKHHSLKPAISDEDDLFKVYEDGGVVYDNVDCHTFEDEFLQSNGFISLEIKRRVFVDYQVTIEKDGLNEAGRRLGAVMEVSSRRYWYNVAISRPEFVEMVFDKLISEQKGQIISLRESSDIEMIMAS